MIYLIKVLTNFRLDNKAQIKNLETELFLFKVIEFELSPLHKPRTIR